MSEENWTVKVGSGGAWSTKTPTNPWQPGKQPPTEPEEPTPEQQGLTSPTPPDISSEAPVVAEQPDSLPLTLPEDDASSSEPPGVPLVEPSRTPEQP